MCPPTAQKQQEAGPGDVVTYFKNLQQHMCLLPRCTRCKCTFFHGLPQTPPTQARRGAHIFKALTSSACRLVRAPHMLLCQIMFHYLSQHTHDGSCGRQMQDTLCETPSYARHLSHSEGILAIDPLQCCSLCYYPLQKVVHTVDLLFAVISRPWVTQGYARSHSVDAFT